MIKLTYEETEEYFLKNIYHNKVEHMTEECKNQLHACVDLINTYEQQDYTSAIFELNHTGDLSLKGTDFALHGEHIKKHLAHCSMALVFVATAGYPIDKLIAINQVKDLTFSYLLDTCAGLFVEKLCDEIQNTVLLNVGQKGYTITNRYSCGYGDFPLNSQGKIISLLNADKKLGIVVTSGGMMTPTKSVSAIIGIGSKVTFEMNRCINCPKNETCTGGLCSEY